MSECPTAAQIAQLRSEIKAHTKRWAAGAAFISAVGLAISGYTQVKSAFADEHVRDETRKAFDKIKPEREAELRYVAEQAAQRATERVCK